MSTIVLIITTLSSGLIAGLFYAWSVSVTPGLAKINDESYLNAFQSMNRAILNPIFFSFFFGLVVLLPAMCYMYFQPAPGIQFWFIVSAMSLYLFGVIAITIFGNVQLNNTLEALDIASMTTEQMNSFRLGFESKWNNLNTIRTVCSSLSFLSLIMACVHNSGS